MGGSAPLISYIDLTAEETEDKKNQISEHGKRSKAVSSYRLFGIDLMKPVPTEEKATGAMKEERVPSSQTPTDSELKSVQSKGSEDKKQRQRKQGYSSARSQIKVQMQGFAVGRAVDLMAMEGYDQLIDELEKMFELNGDLRSRKKLEIVYTDDEGDMMLVGDDPWLEFCNMAKRIFICSSQEAKKMKPGSKLFRVSTIEGGGTTLSMDSSES